METDTEADDLQDVLLRLTAFFNRPQADAALLRRAGSSLERALFPLLIRADHEAVTIGELAERVGRHHTTVSRQVTALEQQGFVRRVVDDGDGRRSLVHVTDKGREETGRIAEARRAGLTAVFEGWSDRERRDLTRLLAKLVTGLETVVATVPAGEQA